MTREDAIKVLNMVEAHGLADEAKRMAIKALEHPEQNVIAVVPCGDAISRQAVLDEIISRLGISGEKYLLESERYIYQIIKDLPTVTPKQRTGHWIEERTHMECPNCHDIWHYEENQTERFKFCPTCGYRMIEPQESEGV